MAIRTTTTPRTAKTAKTVKATKATKAATPRKPRATKSPARDAIASVTAPVEALVSRTGSTIKQRPYTAAAIATGAIATIAGLVAGALFYKRNEKLVNDKAARLGARVKDGVGETSAKARDLASRGTAWVEQKTGRTLTGKLASEAEVVDGAIERSAAAIDKSVRDDIAKIDAAT